MSALVEIYRHAGEKVRNDIAKKDINPTRFSFDYFLIISLAHCKCSCAKKFFASIKVNFGFIG